MIAFIRKIAATLFRSPTWGLVIAVAIALVANISTIVYIVSLQNDLEAMFTTDLTARDCIQSARIKILSIHKDVHNLFQLADSGARDAAAGKILADRRDVESLLAKSKQLYRSRRSVQLVGDAGRLFAECATAIDSLVDISKSGDDGQALGIINGRMREQFDTLDGRLHYLDGLKQRHDLRVFRNIDYQLTISIVFTVIALVISIVIRLVMYRQKKKPGVVKA
ncbi:MAG TPA: MCP four helix bundle domain-containing protein [Chitinivibrionales bacterium]|nr:MCP four helix bundle domain-containing protein [Chitinivibrionales bacterium]